MVLGLLFKLIMDKLTRYKRQLHKNLQILLNRELKEVITDEHKAEIYEHYGYIKNTINIIQKTSVKYTTNLDVCNID
jgi:hypothetical protein